jgi:hypothetical protein
VVSLAAWILMACGVALILIGLFFLAARPPLLPEDARFMGSTIEHIVDAVPALSTWLRRVFWVLGGYVATVGVLVVYIAGTGVTTGSAGALAVVAVAGVTSIGWMSAVNFMIRSDFRWALLCLDGLWILGLLLAVTAR